MIGVAAYSGVHAGHCMRKFLIQVQTLVHMLTSFDLVSLPPSLYMCTLPNIECYLFISMRIPHLNQGMEDNVLDDVFERYTKTVSSAQSFSITQMGISAFKWVEGDAASSAPATAAAAATAAGLGNGNSSSSSSIIGDWQMGGHYEARSFNLYIFPAPLDEWDQRFMCQASSMLFLAEQGFDFNK